MTLRSNLLPVFDRTRPLLDRLGFRQFDVMLRVVAWSGARVGQGTKTVTDTPLTLNDAGNRINVVRLNSRDLIASGGKYQDGDYKIGPLTPAYDGGGRAPSYFDPPVGAQPTEVTYRVTGPGMESGAWFEKVDQDTEQNFGYYFVLRRTNVAAP